VLARLSSAYDEIAKLEIRALPSIGNDSVHQKIDAALASAFEIGDDLARLREMLAREPIVSLHLPNEAQVEK